MAEDPKMGPGGDFDPKTFAIFLILCSGAMLLIEKMFFQ